MATHHQQSEQNNDFYLHVDPTVAPEDLNEFELSNCKSVIIPTRRYH